MLEKPALPDDLVVACLRENYALPVAEFTFLPLGADGNTAVYRAVAVSAAPYFVKLRSGEFDESAVAVPRLLNDRGVRHIIAPLPTLTGHLWAELGDYRLILAPYIESRDAYQVELTERHWRELGEAMRRVHDIEVPPAMAGAIRRETFSARWRDTLRQYLDLAGRRSFDDPVAAEIADFLNLMRRDINDLIRHADHYAATLKARPRRFVLCHSDLHAGNVVIDSTDQLYIVDWDQPIFAPRERDLMYPGGAQGFMGRSPDDEERLFREGYGPVEVDPAAVAYYRFERIVEDIAVFGRDLLLSDDGGADRAQSLRYVKSNFQPGSTIDRAYAAHKSAGWGNEL